MSNLPNIQAFHPHNRTCISTSNLKKIRKIILILAVILLTAFSVFWFFSPFFSENARFEAFAESIFEKEVSGNALNLHYSLAYPEKQGIRRKAASLLCPCDNCRSAHSRA